jgi:hypothetical protein
LRAFLFNLGGQRKGNCVRVFEVFDENFPHALQPDRSAIYNLNKLFRRHGGVRDFPSSGRNRTSLTEENLTTFSQATA